MFWAGGRAGRQGGPQQLSQWVLESGEPACMGLQSQIKEGTSRILQTRGEVSHTVGAFVKLELLANGHLKFIRDLTG